MARPYNRSFRSNVVVGSPALAAETIVAQVANVGTDGASQAVMLWAYVAYTVGTTGSAVTLRIRQTGLAGAVVVTSGAITGGVAAAALRADDIQGFDTPGDVDALTYVVTLQVTAATAASAVSAANVIAIVSD